MVKIPESHHDLLREDVRAFAFLATILASGAPQVTPIWFSYQEGYILINSAQGRVKDRNMRERPEVALAIADPRNPYRYIQIGGRVVEITEEGAEAHIHALSQKYRGKPYTLPQGQVRVIYRIEPTRVDVKD